MLKLQKIVAFIIAWMPFNVIRVVGYKWIFGYSFGHRTKIGLGVLIVVKRFEAGDDLIIRRRTTFVGPMTVKLGNKNLIGRTNTFECGMASQKHDHMNYLREFVTGDDCFINDRHLFDTTGRIEIGSGTWVAGFASQFLTHGASVMDRNITLGSGCFIGSAARFAPGSGVGNGVIVGIGSVVTKRLPGNDMVVAGVPAAKIKDRTPDDGFRFAKDW